MRLTACAAGIFFLVTTSEDAVLDAQRQYNLE